MYVNNSLFFFIFYKNTHYISFYLDAGQEFVSTNSNGYTHFNLHLNRFHKMNSGQSLVEVTCWALITGLRLEERPASSGLKKKRQVWVHKMNRDIKETEGILHVYFSLSSTRLGYLLKVRGLSLIRRLESDKFGITGKQGRA